VGFTWRSLTTCYFTPCTEDQTTNTVLCTGRVLVVGLFMCRSWLGPYIAVLYAPCSSFDAASHKKQSTCRVTGLWHHINNKLWRWWYGFVFPAVLATLHSLTPHPPQTINLQVTGLQKPHPPFLKNQPAALVFKLYVSSGIVDVACFDATSSKKHWTCGATGLWCRISQKPINLWHG